MFYSALVLLIGAKDLVRERNRVELDGLIIAQDAATAGFGLLNAGYFSWEAALRKGRRARRIAALAMALVSLAVVGEAGFSQALFWWGELPDAAWALARLPLLAATLFISILIARRLRS